MAIINGECPEGHPLRWSTESNEGYLYYTDDVPIEVAEEIHNTSAHCTECGCKYFLYLPWGYDRVQMRLGR